MLDRIQEVKIVQEACLHSMECKKIRKYTSFVLFSYQTLDPNLKFSKKIIVLSKVMHCINLILQMYIEWMILNY